MGARSQADTIRDISYILRDIEHAVKRGVSLDRIAVAIVTLERTEREEALKSVGG